MDAQAPPSAAAVAPGVVPPRRMPAAARGRKKQALNVGVALRRRPRSKRVPVRYEDSLDASYSEKVHMRLAMNNSRVVTTRKADIVVPDMPTFRPSMEEFESPMQYIRSIEPSAAKYGVIKIVPPDGWSPPVQMFPPSGASIKFDTKLQAVNRLQEGRAFGDGRKFNLAEYFNMAHTTLRNKFPQFAHSRVRSPTDDDVRKWAKLPPGLSEANLPADASVDPAPATTAPDTTFETGADLLRAIEAEYWRVAETSPYPLEVEYGSDVSAHGVMSGWDHDRPGDGPVPAAVADAFIASKAKAGVDVRPDFSSPEYYKQCGWNLHNLPFAPGSILRHVPQIINGINVPWLYIGMLFASFAWHVEDNYLCSISYLHYGSPKIWYGANAASAAVLEKTMKSQVHARFAETPDLLYHLVTVLSPNVLKEAGVTVHRGVQNPGEFMVTFPRAYHSGFSTGFNCGEAVNFALSTWIDVGRACAERYRKFGRASVLSLEMLMCRLARHGEERSIAECDILIKQLTAIRKEQEGLRTAVREGGVVASAYLGRSCVDRFECCVCRHSCQLSAVVCNCSKERVACLRHFTQLCACDNSSKCFVSYCRMSTLDALLDRVTRRRHKLAKRAQRGYSPKASGEASHHKRARYRAGSIGGDIKRQRTSSGDDPQAGTLHQSWKVSKKNKRSRQHRKASRRANRNRAVARYAAADVDMGDGSVTVSRVSHFTIFEARDPEDLHRAGGSGAETDGHGPVGAPVTELPPHAAVTHPGVSVSALFAPVEPEGLAADGGVTATGAPVPQAAATAVASAAGTHAPSDAATGSAPSGTTRAPSHSLVPPEAARAEALQPKTEPGAVATPAAPEPAAVPAEVSAGCDLCGAPDPDGTLTATGSYRCKACHDFVQEQLRTARELLQRAIATVQSV